MRSFKIILIPLLAASLVGCKDDPENNNTNPDLLAVAPPAAPTLGAQIDRMARAGVNTALTDPFWDDGVQTSAAHKAKQDAYNAASSPAAWGALKLSSDASAKTVTEIFKAALAVYDSLDGTSDGTMADDGCGNQLAYGALTNPNYTTLASVLADDELYVNADSGSCTTYLAVEANVLGVTNTDCGGRTPKYNTIDITYSGLAAGSILLAPGCLTGASACGVSNGITSDADGAHSVTTFPFLADPS